MMCGGGSAEGACEGVASCGESEVEDGMNLHSFQAHAALVAPAEHAEVAV
jgi:hypothetical protein